MWWLRAQTLEPDRLVSTPALLLPEWVALAKNLTSQCLFSFPSSFLYFFLLIWGLTKKYLPHCIHMSFNEFLYGKLGEHLGYPFLFTYCYKTYTPTLHLKRESSFPSFHSICGSGIQEQLRWVILAWDFSWSCSRSMLGLRSTAGLTGTWESTWTHVAGKAVLAVGRRSHCAFTWASPQGRLSVLTAWLPGSPE